MFEDTFFGLDVGNLVLTVIKVVLCGSLTEVYFCDRDGFVKL